MESITLDRLTMGSPYLPTVSDYTKYLNIASLRYNMSLDECRDKYGLFTYKQWYELFND